MSLADRVLTSLRTVVLIDERVTILTTTLRDLKVAAEGRLNDHERRLTRLETIIEIARPDGATLRIAPP
jgi:hypothetical protein